MSQPTLFDPDVVYLLDANVMITADRTYYPMSRVPEFWRWLLYQAESGRVKIPKEMLEEVLRGRQLGRSDPLLDWIHSGSVKESLLLPGEPIPNLVRRVVDEGYGPKLSEDEVQRIGRDPFLIAYALEEPSRRRIVTTEVSKPSRVRANRKIPDVADDFGILTCDPFEFSHELDFRTNWQPPNTPRS